MRNGQNGDDTYDAEPSDKYKNKNLLAEVTEQLSTGEISDEEVRNMFFYASGYVSFMKNDDRTFYLACPECKKKVMEESCGWRCESCDKAQPTCVPTYMLLAKISDVSDNLFVNFYRDEGTALMGIKAEKLRELKE